MATKKPNGTHRAKERAEAVFAKKGPKANKKPEQRVLPVVEDDTGPTIPTLAHHISTIKGWIAKKDTVVGHLRKAREDAKEAGVNLKSLDFFLNKIDKDGADEETIAELEAEFVQIRKMCKARGVMFQVDLFEREGMSPEAKALDDGIRCGARAGDMKDNPHEPNTPLGQLFIQGWNFGQAKNMAGIKKARPADGEVWPDDAEAPKNSKAAKEEAPEATPA